MKTISLIIPCYNEEESVPIMYDSLQEITNEMSQYEFEMLFINDGSKDETMRKLRMIAQKDERVKYISFTRNFGKEAGIYAGFSNVKGDFVAIMDADMQDPPRLLKAMAELLEEGDYDSVATRRVNRKGEPKIRSFLAKWFYKIINKMSGSDIVDGARDFRLMKREMVDAILLIGEYNRFSKGIFGWVGFQTHWLSYENVERVAGKTKWKIWDLFYYAINGIINFSQAPLRIASWCGMGFTFISIMMIILIIVRKIVFADPVQGWASMSCLIIFIGGIQLFCVGIMGAYLSKIYMEVKRRPHYIVKETNILSDSNCRKTPATTGGEYATVSHVDNDF